MLQFSRLARIYILTIMTAGAALCLAQLPDWSGSRVWLFLALAGLTSLTQMIQVRGLIPGSYYNTSVAGYTLALFSLGRPEAAWLVAISHVSAWLRGRGRIPWYAQAFNIGALVIPLSAADLLYRLIVLDRGLDGLHGLLSILAAGLTFVLLNHVMVGAIHYLADGKRFSESGMFGRVLILADMTLFAMGAAAGLIWHVNSYAAYLAVSPLYLIHLTLKMPVLERRAESDAKTGLFNARYFNEVLEKELGRADRFDRPLSVVMADLDFLRDINNTHGHLAGDAVLTGLAGLLRESVREYDVVARFGGEEFAILLPETTPRHVLPRVEAMRAAIEAASFRVATSDAPLKVTMSFGVAGRMRPEQTAEEIVHNADLAMYQAKQTGRNRVCLFDENGHSQARF